MQQGRARGSAFSRMSMPPNARVDPGVRGPVESRPMAGGGGQLANQSSFRVASQHGVAEIVEAPNSGGPAVPNGHDTSSTAMPVFYADDSARALQ